MIVADVLTNCPSEVMLPEQDHSLQTFLFEVIDCIPLCTIGPTRLHQQQKLQRQVHEGYRIPFVQTGQTNRPSEKRGTGSEQHPIPIGGVLALYAIPYLSSNVARFGHSRGHWPMTLYGQIWAITREITRRFLSEIPTRCLAPHRSHTASACTASRRTSSDRNRIRQLQIDGEAQPGKASILPPNVAPRSSCK